MDLGDLFDGIGGSGQLSPRGQRIARILFGGGLAVLSLFGAVYVLLEDGGLPLRIAGATMFVALAAFGLFAIALGRGVKPFGCFFLLSFAGLFVVRIVFGA